MTREEKEQTGKYVLQMARLLEDGCYQQEMLLKAVHIIDEALEQEPTIKNDLGVDTNKLLADCEKMSFDIEIFNKPLKVVALDAVKNIAKDLINSENPNKSEILTGSTTKNNLGVDCISRADVNQVIEDYMDEQYNVLSDRTRERAFGARAVMARINELPSVTPQEPKWIPVSERLPENSGNYLITYCYRNKIETQEAVYSEDEDEVKWFDITDVEITLAVIAWMPLPKAYSGVEK